jgi:serine phosphatase RsbU (regulator of sigma subunit)/putative methionine-R-sulfoxide reductase with GAF domain
VRGFLEPDKAVSFFHHYRSLPMVSIAMPIEGVPTVLIENYEGMRDEIVHLIEIHGRRRLAFIRGPEDHYYSQERYRAYTEALEAHDIPLDSRLVTPPGDFVPTRGVEVVQLLLDERKLRPGIDIDALVAISDMFAVPALRELKGRGIRVPDDVAVVGFNNAAEGRFVRPALTSVRPAFYEAGRRATETLLDLIEGKQVPEQIVLPSELVVRRSCGCESAAVVRAAAKLRPSASPAKAGEEKLDANGDGRLNVQREEILARMMGAVEDVEGTVDPAWAEQLLDGFIAELGGERAGGFLATLDEGLGQATVAAGDTAQNVVSALRLCLLPYLDGEPLSRAEDLWQQARVMIGEEAERVQAHRALQAEQQAEALNQVSQALLVTFDVSGAMDVLADGLPRLDIPGAYLSLYEDPEEPVAWSRLVLACREGERVELGADGVRFPSPQLVPEGIWSQERQYSFVVRPLFFRQNQIGFVLFGVGPHEGGIYETLSSQISSMLHGARLTEQTARRAVQLQTAAEVSRTATSVLDLDVLLQQVVELVQQRFDLYYVGLFLVSNEADGVWAMLSAVSGEAGQQMLAQGHRLKVGGESMIGQCIADHQSCIALDVGEEVVRFENPFLPDTHSEMALPLITREGAVGALSVHSRERKAFGETDLAVFETLAGQLANAIANARAYEQVAQAYDEIQLLNERLKDENLRMTAELEVTQRLQQILLPTEEELEQIEELDIAGFMEPADEVGGDYYDVLKHNGQVKIGIGDVTGHGLESGVVMLMLQTAVRTLMTSDEKDPVRFLSILNRLLQENTQRMQVNKSMTLALLDYEIGQMRVSGQHEQVIVVRKGGQVELKDTLDLGLPLGLVSGVAEFVEEMSIDLQPGDGVVLYSDGITEAENEAEEFYGLERLCQVVGAHWAGTAEKVRDAVVADVKAFIGSHKVYDDITLVVVKQR